MKKTEYSYNSSKERYCDVQRIDTRQIEQLLKSGSMDMCEEVLKNFFDEISFFKIKSLLMRLYVAMDIYILVRTYSKEFGVSNETFVDLFGTIDDIPLNLLDFDELFKFFTGMLEQCVKWRAELSKKYENSVIQKAIKYIEDNYSKDNISLKSTAAFVNLSPTYLSYLFKKETGTNFSDYLANFRIENAKELLCRSSKPVSEIAYEVGFSDYRYFGQIFKKYTGKTPREFQSSSNKVTKH